MGAHSLAWLVHFGTWDVFEANSIVEICIKHIHEAPKPLSARGIGIFAPRTLESWSFAWTHARDLAIETATANLGQLSFALDASSPS